MHYLSDVRLYGFTVFGFWLPLVFWSGYVIFFAKNIRSFWKDAFIMSVAGVLLTFFVFRDGMVGLNDAVSVSAVPAYFLFFRKQAGYWQIAGTTYIASLVSDLVGSPVMGDLHPGWLPYLIFTHQYHAQLSFYQDIGGAGLLDGLVQYPIDALLVIFSLRMLWAYVQMHRSEQMFNGHSTTGILEN